MNFTSSVPPARKKPRLSSISPAGDARGECSEGWTTGAPRFMYSIREISKRSHAISVEDIRDLVLHLIADAPPPKWLRIESAHSIQKVVTVLVPGLTRGILSLPALPTANVHIPIPIPVPSDQTRHMPFIYNTFSHACPTQAPGDRTRMHSVLGSFFQGPVSVAEKAKRVQLRADNPSENIPARYTLSLEQMIENDYPIPSYMADVFQKPSGWAETPEVHEESASTGTVQPKIYAVDCEMCLTEDGNELARICVIDYDSGVVLYDQLVKPPKPILDYLTKWSGITPASLSTATTTVCDVQAYLLHILSSTPTPILLGHSLESDLKALKLCHPRCIDTALIYHHTRGRPLKPGLAWLTNRWCGREIQTQLEGGHNPEEDARACIDLLKLKVEHGPGFGEFKTDHESILVRMAKCQAKGAAGVEKVRSAVIDHGNPGFMHGTKATTSIGCKNDEEVLQSLLGVIPSHNFAFARFTGLADALGWTTPKNATHLTPPPPPAAIDSLTIVLNTLNDQLAAVYAALPPRTAFIMFTGHGDPRRMAHLNARKAVFERAIKNGMTLEQIPADEWWTAQDGRDLEAVVEETKKGLLFISVKG